MTLTFSKPAVDLRKVLDFDIENVPGFYWYDGETTSRLHTIVCAFTRNPGKMYKWQMKWDAKLGLHFPTTYFERFKALVESADAVTGHNILKHDIPILNGYAERNGVEPIKWPHVIDTLKERRKKNLKGVPGSQEFLADASGADEKKMHVGIHTWELAAAGEPKAMKIALDRCISDVKSHIEINFNHV